MIIRIDRAFEKDTEKVVEKNILILIAECIENVQKAKKVNEIRHHKKTPGSQFTLQN